MGRAGLASNARLYRGDALAAQYGSKEIEAKKCTGQRQRKGGMGRIRSKTFGEDKEMRMQEMLIEIITNEEE